MALNKSEKLVEYLKDIVDYLFKYLKDRYPKAMSSPYTYENTDMYLSKDIQVQLIMTAIKILPKDIAKKYLEKQFIDKLESYMYAPANRGAFDDKPLLYSFILISFILPKYNEWLFLYLKRISNYLEKFFQSQASLEFDSNGYIKVSIFVEVIKTLVKTELKIKEFPSWIPDFLERFKKVAVSEVGVEKRNVEYKKYYNLDYSSIDRELTLKEALILLTTNHKNKLKEIKIFLSHTVEVKEDIEQIRLAIQSKYQKSKEYNIIIEHWSNTDKGLSRGRFQHRLNEVIDSCDILYIFFQNRIGEYTKEEFYYGLERLKEKKKPYSMSIFFKDFNINRKAPKDERNKALEAITFQDKIQEINGNQYTYDYTDIADLKEKLLNQLEIDIKKPIPQKPIDILDDLFPKEKKIKIYLKDNLVIPRRDPNFVGREVEIHFVMKELINKKQYAITGIIGNGGVGKSAIANEIIHIIKDSWRGEYNNYLKEKVFVDGIMWIKLEQEQTLKQVFKEQILKQLGVKLDLEDFEIELHKLLLDKDVLIVLDSAEQNQSIFKELIKIFKNYPVLITSREKYAEIKMLELNTLYAKKSFELFKNHLDQEIPQEEEKKITKFCVKTLGGLPLAIKIVANYMKESGRRLSEVNQDLLKIEMKDRFRNETVSIDSILNSHTLL